MFVDDGILSLRPKIRRNAKQSEVVIREAKQGSEEACLKIKVIGNPGQLLETIHSGKQMQALTSDQEQSEKCFKEVEKLEPKGGLKFEPASGEEKQGDSLQRYIGVGEDGKETETE